MTPNKIMNHPCKPQTTYFCGAGGKSLEGYNFRDGVDRPNSVSMLDWKEHSSEAFTACGDFDISFSGLSVMISDPPTRSAALMNVQANDIVVVGMITIPLDPKRGPTNDQFITHAAISYKDGGSSPFAVVAFGSEIVIFDVSHSSDPQEVGRFTFCPGKKISVLTRFIRRSNRFVIAAEDGDCGIKLFSVHAEGGLYEEIDIPGSDISSELSKQKKKKKSQKIHHFFQNY